MNPMTDTPKVTPDEIQVVAYLQNELSDEEREAFEQEMERSTSLRDQVAQSRMVLDNLAASREDVVRKQVTSTIEAMLDKGATALHYHLETTRVVVRFRIGDDLVTQSELEVPLSQWKAILTRWKTLAQLSLVVHRLPQNGQFRASHEGHNFVFHVNVLPTLHGEQLTARVQPQNEADYQQRLGDLGLTEQQQTLLYTMLERTYGLIVIAGPDGSGKTTLGYALLRALVEARSGRSHLLSIEDPIKGDISGVTQCATNHDVGLTVPLLLRSGVFTSDADVVFISEIADTETARLVGQLTLAGCLVIACVTASRGQEALTRLESWGFGAALRKSALLGVVTTNVLRRMSPENVIPTIPMPEHLTFLGLTLADGPFYCGSGHDKDRGTGYKGRVGIYEVSEVSNEGALVVTYSQNSAAKEAIHSRVTTVEEAFRILSL